jgi:hypothetical protein
MPADMPLIRATWEALLPFTREEKCAACECLQGALMELRMGLEDFSAEAERDRLLSAVRQAMKVQNPHGCLGCEPCTPSEILADFYRAQQAPVSVTPCACEDG